MNGLVPLGITKRNVDLLPKKSYGIQLGVILQEILNISIIKMCKKIILKIIWPQIWLKE